jgi:hypothetical protein
VLSDSSINCFSGDEAGTVDAPTFLVWSGLALLNLGASLLTGGNTPLLLGGGQALLVVVCWDCVDCVWCWDCVDCVWWDCDTLLLT